MNKSRLEAYTDTVIAIIITLMILNIQPPAHAIYFSQLHKTWHEFFAYACSFLVLSTYWNNHHHLLQTVKQINGSVLWSNNLFIFTMTLIPFATRWLTNHLNQLDPELLYGGVIFIGDLAYALLIHTILKANPNHNYRKLLKHQIHKNALSLLFNVIGLVSALIMPILSLLISGLVIVILWFIPDRSLEKALKNNSNHES